MLKSWTLRNFKSFGKSQTLGLSGVNVFTGANSSGKSTIVQSMLLLKQTLRYGPPNRTLVLNGPIIKLGTFDDVKNSSTKGGPISFSWEYQTQPAKWVDQTTNAPQPSWLRDSLVQSVEMISGHVEWTIRKSDRADTRSVEHQYRELDRLYPALRLGKLSCVSREGDETSYYSEYKPRANTDKQTVTFAAGGQEATRYDVKFDAISVADISEDKPDAQILGGFLRHFMPVTALVHFDQRALKAAEVSRAIVGSTLNTYKLRRLGIDSFPLPESVCATVTAWAREVEPSFELPSGQSTVVVLRDAIRHLVRPRPMRSSEIERERAQRSAQLGAQIEQLLLAELPEERTSALESPRTLRAAEQTMRGYLTSGIRYLGPLRDEPRPVYPVEALEDTTEVGYRGEHTAAVLDLNRLRLVTFMSPQAIESKSFKTTTGTLQDAIDAWSDYMGVAARVVTRERGVFGHQLQVQTDSSKKLRDLTNVGVGVSQVLPILVMSLLAPPGSLLIFEQPELHLQPKIQARLADFFFASALLGKQCVLETHSEYMIDRFRRRIAEAEGSTLSDLVRIFFVERAGSESRCRRVDISPYGAILDWPADFFDQSQTEAEAILRAASNKRDVET
ncbi:AAA family ATPase [Vitreimonas sp.]|uniref:AAA family ATPase n=1 Tax=Vitreimonas sp. TaxID=3069702 RepID=UPI002EDA16B0